MPDLNIRNIDEDLLHKLKADAATARRTLREHCLAILGGEKKETIPIRTSTERPGHDPTCRCTMCKLGRAARPSASTPAG